MPNRGRRHESVAWEGGTLSTASLISRSRKTGTLWEASLPEIFRELRRFVGLPRGQGAFRQLPYLRTDRDHGRFGKRPYRKLIEANKICVHCLLADIQ